MTYDEKLYLFINAELDRCELELIQAENNYTKFRRHKEVSYQYYLDVLLAQKKLDDLHYFARKLKQFMGIKDSKCNFSCPYIVEIVADERQPEELSNSFYISID